MESMSITQEQLAGTVGPSDDTGGSDGNEKYSDDTDEVSDDREEYSDEPALVSSWSKSRHPPLPVSQRSRLHEAIQNCELKLKCRPGVCYAFVQRVAKTYVAARASRKCSGTYDN